VQNDKNNEVYEEWKEVARQLPSTTSNTAGLKTEKHNWGSSKQFKAGSVKNVSCFVYSSFLFHA